MSEIRISTTRGGLALRKSKQLVGLKGRPATSPPEVGQRLLPDVGGFEVVSLPVARDVEEALDEVRQRPEVEVGTHVYFADHDNRPVVPTGIIYCTLAPGVGEEESQRVFDLFHLEVLERRPAERTVVLSATARSRNPLYVARQLEKLAMVSSAVPDLDVPLDQYFTEPRDGLFSQQWSLSNPGHVPGVPGYPTRRGADARVQAAWKRLGSLGSPEVTVAIIDNGFDLQHPDLSAKSIVAPLTISSGASTLPTGIAHGTHATPCASVAVAAANGTGIVGAAPRARLMPLHGLTYSAYLTERMFDHCIRNGADVISCSWGTVDPRFRPGTFHERAVRRAVTEGRGGKGCIVIFAAGNEGKHYLNYYCELPGVIAVGASTSNDTHPAYSNRGSGLSVVAPSDGGWPLLAARASWDPGHEHLPPGKRYYVDGRDRGPHHKHFGGTSGATPLVAGVCALLLSAHPGLTAAEVKSILERTADKIGDPGEYDVRGYSNRFGYGRVNADRAVAEALRLAGRPAPATPASLARTAFRVRAEDPPRSGFGLQVSAFRQAASALELATRLEQQFELPVVVAEAGGMHKVILGTFADAPSARKLLPRARELGYQPFVRDLSTLS
ncbi:subtilisin family serine protease [Lewinella marina]|uniref:Peptidase S8 and S53 subtilisin kexin sedolisin n=1 Tax=Neolewinella marina TaxID=438751 RepID=A0A2G0CJ44_9BACT|nr:S8 family serine peptidase [Neolewinella marina]NJB84845.1 subtilisin family serine protease [Neolewinella marina]PHK99999.1 peptidase S8 and S53 subtilisin kexin sedolisin [Neolewinella marina]